MKKTIITTAVCAMASMANATLVLVTNGDFEAGASNWGNFASGGTVVSFPATGGNTGGFGKVDNTAGAWGGGLVSPADFEFPGNTGIPLASMGLVAGETYTFQMDMINLAGDGLGGVKFESWGAAMISNTGDVPASGQSSSWATYTWDYTIDAAATSIKIVPLLTGGSNNAGGSINSSIGFDNVGVNVVPEPSGFALAALGALGLLGRRSRK
ncbi:PEP-CTERM sorting domain-containing protein [Akkermansiaceae bacterium]|nr:PEP-CTERM sorting domain-containing protein [Akkermansiaceae bacterium]